MTLGKIAVLLVVLVLFGTCGYAAADCVTGGAQYQAIGDGTVQDCQTGLIWLQNANCKATSNSIDNNPNQFLSWYAAQKWVAGLQDGLCGLSDGSSAGDWRLPTKTEWMAMIAYAYNTKKYTNPTLTNDAGTLKWSSGAGSSFINVLSDYYWSSTTYENNPAVIDYAWYVNLYLGYMSADTKAGNRYVWPVRGGQSGSFGNLRIE
jgi:hypothetical protein